MASGMTPAGYAIVLNFLLRGITAGAPATLYCGLSATAGGFSNSTATGEVTTATIGSYSRTAISVASGSWAAPSAASTSNAAAVVWTNASSGSGVSLLQWGLFDASTSGNLILWADLSVPQTVASGNPYSIAVGSLVVGGI